MTPQEILEKSRKSWDYIVSDERVYGFESCGPNLKPSPHAIDWFSKYDLGHLWIDLHFRLRGKWFADFNAIAEIASPQVTGANARNSEIGIDRVDGQDSVLVDLAKFIQPPERIILRKRPSVIRLKRLDDRDGNRENVFGGIPKTFGLSRITATNREEVNQ
jgi:hypothetical protein